nr:hypothetical protein [Pandoravirus aubagnensis]
MHLFFSSSLFQKEDKQKTQGRGPPLSAAVRLFFSLKKKRPQARGRNRACVFLFVFLLSSFFDFVLGWEYGTQPVGGNVQKRKTMPFCLSLSFFIVLSFVSKKGIGSC